MKTDSVAKGGATIILARILGMGCAFLLFVLLARHSEVEAGVFRTVATFLLISEFLGLMGTHRWLAVEIATAGAHRWPMFLAGCALAVLSAVVLALVYAGISFSGLYGAEISKGLWLAALSTLPSALLTCIQSTLMGVGLSQRMGLLNLVENVGRAVVGIACVWAGLPVLSVIVVFVVARWLIAAGGFYLVFSQLDGDGWRPSAAIVRQFIAQIPRFAVTVVAFLVVRNAAMIMLPALVDERETAFFAVSYQLYDLALLIPTILALSSTFLFANNAAKSPGALRWAVAQLWSITSIFLLPVTMLALVFGADLLHSLFGRRYDASVLPFFALMLAALLMALDQVLSQAMQASKRYREDSVSVVLGAVLVVIGTAVLGDIWGATGAAVALLLALMMVVPVRFIQLRGLIGAGLLFWLSWRPLLASLLAAGTAMLVRAWLPEDPTVALFWAWIPVALLGVLIYFASFRALGGFSAAKRGRMRKFLLSRR